MKDIAVSQKPVRRTSTDQLERYRLLIDSVQDYAIFLLETDGTVASWNAGAQRFKGYAADEIIGRHFSTFYPQIDKDARKPENELITAMKVGRIEDEGWRVRKDGTTFWANVVITTLYDESGEHIGFAKVTRDLTERKAMEDQIIRANSELRRQQHELKLLNEVKDEFVSLASHQLRTPATGVKQYIGMLMEGLAGELTPKQQKLVEKAYDSNERQISMVNDLLKVAQMDAGKLALNKQPTDMPALISDVMAGMQEVFQSRKQSVGIRTDVPLTACVDAKHFRMVLDNLIDNASKYTPHGGDISVSLAERDDCYAISICDNGVGISDEDKSRLFEKFSRVKNSLSDEVGGSGLGLYWAGRIVSLHGGHIHVDDAPGGGTMFTIILPKEIKVG